MKKQINFKHISVYKTPQESPGFLLWQVSTTWRTCIEKALKSLDLTHPQFVTLATLGWLTRNGDLVTQASVGKMARLDPNTMSQILRGLEKKKLIKRVQSTDIRAKHPLLTLEGSRILALALPLVEKVDTHFFELLSDKEVSSMIQMFIKLV